MALPEYREYVVRGSIPAEDWGTFLSILHRYDLSAGPVADNGTRTTVAAATGRAHESALPYGLADIKSRSQYVATEHAAEFWPIYLAQNRGQYKSSKHEALFVGLGSLTHPSPRRTGYNYSDDQSLEYGTSLGLKLVRPRTEVGFPAKSLLHYGLFTLTIRSWKLAACPTT